LGRVAERIAAALNPASRSTFLLQTR